MLSETAALYDLLCSSVKDYPAEAETIAALIHRLHPHARSVLDVACGTGEHARLLAEEYGYQVDGLDIGPALVRIARDKVPTGAFHTGDMADFSLGRSYDVVLCLFSSIGYVRTLDGNRGT